MFIPLFTFHFSGRVIVCVRYGIHYAKKRRIRGKTTTRFCSKQCHKQNETIQKNKKFTDKRNIVYLNSAALS